MKTTVAIQWQLEHSVPGSRTHLRWMLENILKILIIDTDQRAAARLTDELKRQEFTSLTCRIGTLDELQSSIEGGRPDLVFSELNIGGVSGFLALDIVRGHCPDLPFIFVSQSYSPGVIVEVFENGGNGHIPKHHLSDLREVILQAQASCQPAPVADKPLDTPKADFCDDSQSNNDAMAPARTINPICPRCNRISNLEGHWQPLEIHLRLHSSATVALGTCPDCAEKLFQM